MPEHAKILDCMDGIGDNGLPTKVFDVFSRNAFAATASRNDGDVHDSSGIACDSRSKVANVLIKVCATFIQLFCSMNSIG